MGKSDLRTKNDRTIRLLGLLRTDEHWTTERLAQELKISHRTLMRDLEYLRDAGYPIESDRGRGGGIRLNGRWGIERLNLTNREAISLLLSLSVTEALTGQSNNFGSRGLKQKIANVFPSNQRKIINELRIRILIGQLAASKVLINFKTANSTTWEDALMAFFDSKKVQIEYIDEKGAQTRRDFDPHYLLLNWPVWYFLGWDYLKNDVRIFRLDRIQKLKILNEPLQKRPQSVFLDSYESFFTNV